MKTYKYDPRNKRSFDLQHSTREDLLFLTPLLPPGRTRSTLVTPDARSLKQIYIMPDERIHNVECGVSVQSRIIPFWREQPSVWFVQFEAVIEPLKKSDEQKYVLLLQQLKEQDLRHITDLLKKPPSSSKYEAVKRRLIATYEETDVQNYEKLIGGQELGDQKPTQLLRRIRDLGTGILTEEGLRIHWMKQMPAHIRTVLAINTETSLDTLAVMADRMLDVAPTAAMAPVSCTDQLESELSRQIAELAAKVDALRHGRSQSQTNSRDTSRNRAYTYTRPRHSQSSDRGRSKAVCWYHHTFREKASRCSSPCSWKTTARSGN